MVFSAYDGFIKTNAIVSLERCVVSLSFPGGLTSFCPGRQIQPEAAQDQCTVNGWMLQVLS